MGDILPPKRQTVVDRLRRRIELYRRHQGSCLPRYDQASNGLYENHRQDTLLLKQRFLEAKAKKSRRGNAKDNSICLSDSQRNSIVPKLNKRPADSPLLDCGVDGIREDQKRQPKIPCNSHAAGSSHDHHQGQQHQHQGQQQQTNIPSFSVQIVQQFTSSNTSEIPHSQTIQTNVTVKALTSNIKSSDSPLASSSISTSASPAGGQSDAGTSISVGTNIQCKQERDHDFGQCCNLNPCSGGNNGGGLVLPQEGAGDSGDRFSDSLTNLGFPEDTSDEVIHPDILKDLIDDVFTNPGDLVNGFNFVDNIVNVKEEESSQNADDTMMGMGKILPNASTPQSPFPQAPPPVISFSGTQTQQTSSPTGVFDFPPTGMAATTSPGLPTTGYPTNPRMSYPTSTNLSMGSSLGLDFKLTEPSPAAQTLKQMAEQHQNMQQKQQQQIGLGLSSPHPRSPFGADPFPDSMTMRPNFLNGSMHKGSSNMFNPVGFAQQPGYGAVPPTGGITVKQEAGTSMYGNMAPSGHIPEVELHKRRQQALHMQQQQQQVPRVKPEQNPTNIGPRFVSDQKPVGSATGVTYGSTRPLSHFSDPVGGTRAANQSPVSLSNEYIRGVPGPEVTPPPPFATQGVPATANVHLTQSQQLQISQNNQQLQVNQDQKFMVGQDMKQQTTVSSSQQQNVYASYGPPHSAAPTPGSFQMSQSQSVSFGVQYASGRTAAPPPPNMADPVARQQLMKQQQGSMSVAAQRQAQMQHYMARPPPPEYSRQGSLEGQLAGVQQQQMLSGGEGGIMAAAGAQNQRYSPVSAQRRTMGRSYPENPGGQLTTGHPSPQNPTPPLISTPSSTPDLNSDGVPSQLMMPAYNPSGAPPSGPQQGLRPNMAGLNKPVYTSALPRMQKPNISREGLCINPRAPAIPGDWRQGGYLHQQHQPRSRMPYPRAMQPTTYGTTSSSGMSMDNPMMLHSRPVNEGVPMSRMQQLPPVSNNQMMLQQQQIVVGQTGHPNSPSAGQTVTMQMAASVSMTTPGGPPHHQVYPQAEPTNVAPPGVQDNNQFSFDFLDTLDCSASDLLNFDQVMQGDGSGAGFGLLEDIGMLGK